jgi:HEPN domain-containing protein
MQKSKWKMQNDKLKFKILHLEYYTEKEGKEAIEYARDILSFVKTYIC